MKQNLKYFIVIVLTNLFIKKNTKIFIPLQLLQSLGCPSSSVFPTVLLVFAVFDISLYFSNFLGLLTIKPFLIYFTFLYCFL